MSRRISLALCALLLLVTPLLGCSKIKQAVQPKPKIVTKEATVAVAGAPVDGELPKDTSSWLPVWPKSTVKDTSTEAGSISVTLQTSEKYKDVVAGTSVGFERAGWKVSSGAEEASATVLNVSNDSYEGFVTLSQETSSVLIEYFVAPTQK